MTFLRRAFDNWFSRAYLLTAAAVTGMMLIDDSLTSRPSPPLIWLALPTMPTSLVSALAMVRLGGDTGPYWWVFPVGIVTGAVLNAAVIGSLLQARRSSRLRT